MFLVTLVAFLPLASAGGRKTCVDLDNAIPPRARYGHISWMPSTEPLCRTPFPLVDGECFAHMNVGNKCRTFCKTVSGWYHGAPIDLMPLQRCDRWEDCARTFGYTESLSKSQSLTDDYARTEKDNTVTTASSGTTVDMKLGWKPAAPAEKKPEPKVKATLWIKPKPLLADSGVKEASANIGGTAKIPSKVTMPSIDVGVKLEGNWKREWTKTVTTEKTFKNSNTTTFVVNIEKGESLAKPKYAADYCGSWFAVPQVGVDCGRAAVGVLTETNHCALDADWSSFTHCFDYTFKEDKQVEATVNQFVFVLRDCQEGFILPGEWQQPAFQQSVSIGNLVEHHIQRFGFDPLPSTRNSDPSRVYNIADVPGHKHTKLLGPEDHTIKICGRGGYCARHKLPDKACFTFPRGYVGYKSAHVISVATTPGNCCVLFSKPECYGLPQLVKGAIDDFFAVGYVGMAHSVMCNVDEYCSPDRLDQMSFESWSG
ncbi:hypothetical protein QBC47DRAFT_362307 [Echria macrotheca]|uniref:Uncharacterized protein n=1 Tax=Echria macrotheca TaxID=438768 RepID=A0AAJ0F7J7_9PEZI|nr:hypothetical protein QBC47DRAFT_362307 [Echria macrotheca]